MFGRYRMLGRIAAGGMAEVWAAQLLAPGGFCKAMVIKRVLPELAENPSFLRMLMTEARVAARLSHTNICAVFELGEVQGEYYIAMEYLRGAPLSHVLKTGGRLDPAVAVSVVAQACDGLHYAHDQRDASGNLLGLVHRDVSPHNLFVTVDGIVKVLDFGIAKVDDGSSERTEAGKVKGKLAYMSPEQLAADPLDRRSDVWSLGCVLWELLTGRRLFAGGPAQTVDGIRNARVPSLSTAALDLPKLDDVLGRAICKNREWRYATAADLKRAMLEAIAPKAPAQNDALTALVWERCGNEIRTQDRKFEGTEADTLQDEAGEAEAGVVDRLPLRAGNTTQVSQEVYINDGVPATALSDVLRRLEPEPRADTSPDLPSNRSVMEDSGSVLVAAAPVKEKRSKKGLVATLVLLAAVGGMVVGVLARKADEGDTKRAATSGGAAADERDPVPDPAPSTSPSTTTTTDGKAETVTPIEPAKPDTIETKPETVTPIEPAMPDTIETKPETVEKPKKKKVEKPKIEKVEKKVEKPKVIEKPGKLYVNAQPWATIYLDGKKLGPTPIVGESVDAGDHVLKAVTEDGRVKSMKIHVDSGGTVRRKVTW
jgi:serine/threonine-protein kinase